MKKLLLASLLFPVCFYSQNIEGLSVFKLGSYTVQNLKDYAAEKKIEIKDCNSYACSSNGSIVKLSPNPTETFKSPTYAVYSPNAEVYQLNNFKINDEYTNRSVILSFYKNKLYNINISSPSSKLIDDLELKYGDGELKKRESTDRCRIAGESFELPSETFSKTWSNTEKNFSMLYLLMSGRDSDCKPRVLTSLSITDKNYYDTVSKESDLEKKRIENEVNAIKKDKLKDL